MLAAYRLATRLECRHEVSVASRVPELVGNLPNLASSVVGVEQRSLDLPVVLLIPLLLWIHYAYGTPRRGCECG